jgi:parallel beta-helix repeat protein
MNLAKNVTVRNMIIEDVLGRGVDAAQSVTVDIGTSRFTRTGRAAISGPDIGYSLNNFSIHDNMLSESGVTLNGNVVTNLPANIVAAIQPGAGATVKGNRISGTSYAGIVPLQNSLVSDNYVENTCLVLDDCAAIYISTANSNSQIDHNTVIRVVGSKSGKPASHYTTAEGIYLDEHTSGVTVSNNTVVDAIDGILLHDASDNTIQNNTLYGNRRFHLLLQEDSNTARSAGDVHGNVISGNRFFRTDGTPSIHQNTVYSSTADAASYNSNLYFTLMSPTVAEERWSSGSTAYSFPQWQSATTSNGTPRNLDSFGSEVNSNAIGYAFYNVTGSNIVPNGNLAAGMTLWSAWNEISPYGQTSTVSCRPGQCLKYVAGGSVGLLTSPYFTVVQGQWYRLSFDLQGSADNQSFYAGVMRGGGGTNGYESLMTPGRYAATTGMQRYNVVFQSTKTINVNDPATLDRGARVHFSGIQPGQTITVTNVELVPISAVTASLKTNILVNPTANTAYLDCPLVGPEASSCSDFVRFTDAQPVVWPYPLAPGDSEIIYTRDSTLTDSDRDGIPDSQDTCASTLAGQSVNAKGCSFSQNYP